MMISVLIAGSYTPICLLVLGGRTGLILLAIVWAFAIAGILIKAFWVFCPKWVSSVLYIGMGWTCVLAFTQLLNSLSPAAFGWLLAGGIIYTVGGVIYALKLPIFNNKHKYFGSHEIFHLFVMAGSACHFVVMYALSNIHLSLYFRYTENLLPATSLAYFSSFFRTHGDKKEPASHTGY